ncbi:radical SAM protein, partial [Ruminococcaceae bacterium OttesenSCG-928-L11]|nr:radical SAM protein [Ruminococcaceae bacterium OttesenSCG-928-L11]
MQANHTDRPVGLYIHIPFCIRKCPYCDFYSIPFSDEAADAYARAVCTLLETGMVSAINGGTIRRVDTVYFGGGTPSLMGPKRLGAILDAATACYSLSANGEITIEANPATDFVRDLAGYRQAGINRLSVGVQSCNDGELRHLGRLHNRDTAL